MAQGEVLGPESWHRPESGVLDQRLAAFARTPVDTANPQQMVSSVAVGHCRSCLSPETEVFEQWMAVVANVRLVIPNRVDVDHTAPGIPMLSLMSQSNITIMIAYGPGLERHCMSGRMHHDRHCVRDCANSA